MSSPDDPESETVSFQPTPLELAFRTRLLTFIAEGADQGVRIGFLLEVLEAFLEDIHLAVDAKHADIMRHRN